MTNDEKIEQIQGQLRDLINKLDQLKTERLDSWGEPITDSWGDSWG